MIPPLAPGQSDEGQNMVGWKNTFNMRQMTLMNLAASHLVLRGNAHPPHSFNCMQNGCISSPAKSLDILRKNLQNAINKDIDNVIKKYLEKFFQPAINNIRSNLGRESINEDHIKDACCKILDEAKSMYRGGGRSRDSSPYDYSDSETGSLVEYKAGGRLAGSPVFRKRKESDTDSEASGSARKRLKAKTAGAGALAARAAARRDGPQWNPERLAAGTQFIMGARANKALGFGQKRGQLYVRHPELVRYAGDPEDKEWLAQQGLMPATRGKAYLMVLDDIRELARSDLYRHCAELRPGELRGFEAPPFLLAKVRRYVERERALAGQCAPAALDLLDLHAGQSLDSAPSTPSDTLHLLECQSASTLSSGTNPFAPAADLSPASSHSFTSGCQLAQSPAGAAPPPAPPGPPGRRATDSDHSTLSDLLAGHLAGDNSRDHDF